MGRGSLFETVAPGVARVHSIIANAYLVGEPGETWILVDSGTPRDVDRIRRAAAARYGEKSRPAAIVLTHGHFDHAGSARVLANFWDVPVYAHRLEAPYLSGQSEYPPKDPTVGGFMGMLSRFFPSRTVHLGTRLAILPEAGEVPGRPDWRWRFTPGHSPGHVAFFNARDSVLLAGDAITTVDLDSWIAVMTNERKVCRPPAPFTCDWKQAHASVRQLAELAPAHIACGHGVPMSGPETPAQLRELASHFPAPKSGRYARMPARTDHNGVRWLPRDVPDPLPGIAAGVGAAVVIGAALAKRKSD